MLQPYCDHKAFKHGNEKLVINDGYQKEPRSTGQSEKLKQCY